MEIAEAHRFDPLICDAIINVPILPLAHMHSWWNRPNLVLDVRPVEPIKSVRFYRLGSGQRILHCDRELDLRSYDPIHDAPLALSARLYPYGTETFFAER